MVYRAYMETFLTNQINSVEAGSEEDILYAVSDRTAPEMRLEALQDILRFFKTEDSWDYEICTAEHSTFPAELPNFK